MTLESSPAKLRVIAQLFQKAPFSKFREYLRVHYVPYSNDLERIKRYGAWRYKNDSFITVESRCNNSPSQIPEYNI